MYTYNFVKTPWFCNYYSKYLRKSILLCTSVLLLLADLFIFLFLYYFLNEFKVFNGTVYISVLALTVLLEIIALLYYCNKEIKNTLNNIKETSSTLSFTEDGISISSDDMVKHINWEIIKNVHATKYEFSFQLKANGIPSNIFFFSFFDSSREDILENLEKYIPVKREE